MNIQGVYEIAIKVRNLTAAERFYCDVLGFEIGLRDPRRPWIFLRVGSGGMIVLQEEAEVPQQHFAFMVADADLGAAVAELGQRGIPAAGPMVHEWIPAQSLYFTDPDGHDVELCAPLARRERQGTPPVPPPA